MIVDWISFIFGAASATEIGLLVVDGIAVSLAVRSTRYKAHPLFQDKV